MRKLAIPLVLLAGRRGAVGAARHASCPSGFVPDEDQGYALVGVQLPDAASLQRTRAVSSKVEEILARSRGIARYNTIAGFSFFTRTAASYGGTVFVGFKPWDERDEPTSSTAERSSRRLNRQFAAHPRGARRSRSRRRRSPASAPRAASA